MSWVRFPSPAPVLRPRSRPSPRRGVTAAEHLGHMLARRARRVFRRALGGAAVRQAFDPRVVVGIEEQRDRVAVAAARVVEHAVHGGHVQVVGPALHHVAEVHDQGPRDRVGAQPFARGIAHFESAHVVLEQEVIAAPVGVRARAELVAPPRRRDGADSAADA